MKKTLVLSLLLLLCFPVMARKVVYHMKHFGIHPNNTDNTAALTRFLQNHPPKLGDKKEIVLRFDKGTYNFRLEEAPEIECFISNHDQQPLRKTVFHLNHYENLTIDGGGAQFLFQGALLPIVLNYCENVTLKNFSIDFVDPQIEQVEIIKSDTTGIRFKLSPFSRNTKDYQWLFTEQGYFETQGENWRSHFAWGIGFDKETHHILHNTGDLGINLLNCRQEGEYFYAPNWKDLRLKTGNIVVMRNYHRPCPGIFLNESKNTKLQNVTVNYAWGMGLIAQRCTDIILHGFNVYPSNGRYFSTQADATHFSQCRGKIISRKGIYEGMMDDAINVHGVYLRILQRKDDYTAICAFMHSQAYGFNWGNTGDSIRFINSTTLDSVQTNVITAIRPQDAVTLQGMKSFLISFRDPIPAEADCIENLKWTPSIVFSGNTIRNNRARGALFSSPRYTLCEKNLFDHTSGSAILLSGDANGWYESGPVNNIVIRRNRFINALTSRYQFTNAVISIYPEIPELKNQRNYYHNRISIENNLFDTFDTPLVYAKSVHHLIFRNNKVKKNSEFPPFLNNTQPIITERVEKTTKN